MYANEQIYYFALMYKYKREHHRTITSSNTVCSDKDLFKRRAL